MDAASAQQRTSDDVNDILKRKRKVREHKACYPCRKRKVRCDSNVPCKTCVDRNHADLCTFNPPSARRDSNASNDDSIHFAPRPRLSIQQDDWDRVNSKLVAMERALTDLKDDLRLINGPPGPTTNGHPGNSNNTSVKNEHYDASSPEASTHERSGPPPNGPSFVKAMEMNEHNQLTGDPVHIGGGSIPALINALGKGGEHSKKFKQVFGGSGMLPLFGLDNESATYPFISLWGYTEASTRIAELRKGLPSDAECLETFRQYREGAHVTYPAIPCIDVFEKELVSFLSNRRLNDAQMRNANSNDSMDGYSIKWIGLLFAVFASGAQFSPISKRDRDLLSQVYACCSFECLRLVNYLSNASLEVVQTMLILGNTLSNGMNAGAAWVLLGMTLRLARTLGCHAAADREEAVTGQDLVASKIWWAVLWQDSMLSLSYDRATSTATPDNAFPPSESPAKGLTFYECMYRIAKVGLLTVRNRVAPQSIESRLDRCVDLRADIARTREQAVLHLRDVRKCRSTRDQCEYWALHLHASYMTSELCRPAISPGTSDFDKGGSLRRQCITHLLNTVEAFTGLAGASPVHSRSWHVVQRALSAALLLGILGEPLRNNRAHDTLRRLISVIRDNAGGPMAGQQSPPGEELPAPILRSISALNKLCAPETITPRNMDEPTSTGPAPTSMPAGALPYQQHGPGSGFGASAPGSANGGMASSPGSANEHAATAGGAVATPSFVTAADDAISAAAAAAGGPALDFDESAFFLPTPLAGFEDESSPYALMDSILWGGNRSVG